MKADATLDGLRFLTGRWVGSRSPGSGERVEEVWSRASEHSMMGMYCWSQDGTPVLYQFLLLEEGDTGVVMRMDTLSAGPTMLAAHKRPQLWRLERCIDGEEAVFESTARGVAYRITYRRQGDDRLYAQLEREEDGRSGIYPSGYERAALDSSC